MKQTKKRRHIYITDDNYKKIAAKAIDEGQSKWEIIDKALKDYFNKEKAGR